MGEWVSTSKTHVASMDGNDFRSNEVSATVTDAQAGPAKIEFTDSDGNVSVLKDASTSYLAPLLTRHSMRASALRDFLRSEIAKAKEEGVLFSLHMKATMMKVSDPIIFGHAVSVFFEEAFEKHADALQRGVNPNSGLGDVLDRIADQPETLADFNAIMADKAPMYMVDSDRGITNLHVPSDVIIDASMPAVIRAGGKGWGQMENQRTQNV